jgi:hypothetical protein
MTKWTKIALAAGVWTLVASTGAAAAPTQGTLGANSTGSISISASVPGRVRISGLSDVVLAPLDLSVDATDSQNVCVWSNTVGRKYSIVAKGSGAGDAFELDDGSAKYPYTVSWNAAGPDQSSGVPMTAGTPLTSLSSSATSSDCAAGASKTATLFVSVSSPTLQTMTADTDATGSLTLLVAPE